MAATAITTSSSTWCPACAGRASTTRDCDASSSRIRDAPSRSREGRELGCRPRSPDGRVGLIDRPQGPCPMVLARLVYSSNGEGAMAETYSTYEAKAKFSEILRKVRAGQRVVIAYRGEEIAEIRRIDKKSLAANLRDLERQGILSPLVEPRRDLA